MRTFALQGCGLIRDSVAEKRYNQTKPQPRIWQSATRASDHRSFYGNERG